MAEHPGAIRNCFLNTEYTDRGKYKLRLWDGRAGRWETIVVDDYFPVEKGTKNCVYMKPNGGELWAILMVGSHVHSTHSCIHSFMYIRWSSFFFFLLWWLFNRGTRVISTPVVHFIVAVQTLVANGMEWKWEWTNGPMNGTMNGPTNGPMNQLLG